MLRSPKKYNSINGFYVMEQTVPNAYQKDIYAVVEIDEYPIVDFPVYALDVQELVNSLNGSGTYRILTEGDTWEDNDCPAAEEITVTHYEAHTSWLVKAPILDRIYQFEASQYRCFVERMKSNLRQIVEENHRGIAENTTRLHPFVSYQHYEFLQDLITEYRI